MRHFITSLFARVETVSLILWLGAAGAVWVFLNLASEVGEGETLVLDRRILLALRNPANSADPIGPRWFEESMRDVTALGGFTVLTLLVIVATLAFAFHKKWRQAVVLPAVVIAAQISNSVLKLVYARPRPDIGALDSYVYSHSFPSGHSAMAAATFLTLATLVASLETRRPTKVLAYSLSALLIVAIGFSRIYLGVHWPTDVLAGWTSGAAWALVGWLILRTLELRDRRSKLS